MAKLLALGTEDAVDDFQSSEHTIEAVLNNRKFLNEESDISMKDNNQSTSKIYPHEAGVVFDRDGTKIKIEATIDPLKQTESEKQPVAKYAPDFDTESEQKLKKTENKVQQTCANVDETGLEDSDDKIACQLPLVAVTNIETSINSQPVLSTSRPLTAAPLNSCPYCGEEEVRLVQHLNYCQVAPSPSCPVPFDKAEKEKIDLEKIKSEQFKDKIINAGGKFGGCQICDPDQHVQGSEKHCSNFHTVSSDDIVPCEKCWEWFETNIELSCHITFHGKDPNYLYCNICSRKFTAQHQHGYKISNIKSQDGKDIPIGQKSIDAHLKSHTLKMNCDECGKICMGPIQLKSHIKSVHATERRLCHICEKSFVNAIILKYHVEDIHDDDKKLDFLCEHCDKKFSRNRYLKIHKKQHLRKFACDKCAKLHPSKAKLAIHFQQVHTVERPYKCTTENCNVGFVTSTKLKYHMFAHTGERLYQCDPCGAKFKRPDTLKKHIMLHTGEKPHVCSHCGEGFVQFGNMKNHEGRCKKKID